MTTFIKAKLKKSEDQTNIVKYRVAPNITKYQIKSNLIFRRNIIPKFMMLRQLFHIKKYVIMLNTNIFKMDVGTFWLQL